MPKIWLSDSDLHWGGVQQSEFQNWVVSCFLGSPQYLYTVTKWLVVRQGLLVFRYIYILIHLYDYLLLIYYILYEYVPLFHYTYLYKVYIYKLIHVKWIRSSVRWIPGAIDLSFQNITLLAIVMAHKIFYILQLSNQCRKYWIQNLILLLRYKLYT